MIRRPINKQFNDKVLAGIKVTTIREKPWPVGVPIMLYNWEGAAYRSKQVDVAVVVVESTHKISMWMHGGTYKIRPHEEIALGRPTWQCEGFESREAMDAWFRPLIKPGQTIATYLMQFRLYEKKGGSEP